jgi:hypothetical protein
MLVVAVMVRNWSWGCGVRICLHSLLSFTIKKYAILSYDVSTWTYACFRQCTSTLTSPRMFRWYVQEHYSDSLFSLNKREYFRDKSDDGVVSIHLSHLSPSLHGYDTGTDSQPLSDVQKASVSFSPASCELTFGINSGAMNSQSMLKA